MSAKLLQALTDENPDLHKQIGCMTGIFQIFDRHHILTGKRINSPRRLPSAQSRLSSVAVEAEETTCNPPTVEKPLSKNRVENQRASVESSSTSLSSSPCSSSFSSLESTKVSQPEPPASERASLQNRPSRSSHKSQSSKFDHKINSQAGLGDTPGAATQSVLQPLDIRDVVKDSIYREKNGLSVKTLSREERVGHVPKHRDSPRPLQLSKSMDGGFSPDDKTKITMDLTESFRVLAKLKEAPWHFNEAREPSGSSYEGKDGSFFPTSRDGPRFSYDGRELSRSSFDSRETSKTATKLRDLPRLSLDGRDCSLRSSLDLKSSMILRDLHPDSNEEMANHKPQTSIVAKLMGLESMPNSISVNQKHMHLPKAKPLNDRTIFASYRSSHGSFKSSKVSEESRQDRGSVSPRCSLKEASLPRSRNSDPRRTPILGSRFPIEPAPWRQQENCQVLQKSTIKNCETSRRPPISQSVYSEMEKRLKDLEFKQSDKDLRALKQILGAIQAKGLLDNKKDETKASESLVQKNYLHPNQTERVGYPGSLNRRSSSNRSVSVPLKGNTSPGAFESPIVIMKPAKLVARSGLPAAVFPIEGLSGIRKLRPQDLAETKTGSNNSQASSDSPSRLNLRELRKKATSRSEESSSPKPRTRLTSSPSRIQLPPKENAAKSSVSGASSPRLHHRKLESDRRSRPPIPSPDPNKPRRQHARQQQTESGSPGGRLRPKFLNDDQSSEVSSETRNLSHLGDEVSTRSESNASLASQYDVEVTSADRSEEMVSTLKQDSYLSLKQDSLLIESTVVGPEQPSPVSVLDASFYRDDLLPSPVKNVTTTFTDEETRNPGKTRNEDGWNVLDVDQSHSGLQSCFKPEINQKKLESIERLVQKLRRLNSAHDEATIDHIASLCDNTNPDHRYISEILLASGLLLKDLQSEPSPIQFHHTGHPINPDLFLVLEHRKARWVAKDEEQANKLKASKDKTHRKLIFNVVNEILLQKLSAENQIEPWVQASKLHRVIPSGQWLLKDLCSEIDHLHSAGSDDHSDDDDDNDNWMKLILRGDVARGESWIHFHKEVPSVVLDIERLIFKDLVDEIVNLDSSGLPAKPSRRRKLFPK